MNDTSALDSQIYQTIRSTIINARGQAYAAVNFEMVLAYWEIGQAKEIISLVEDTYGSNIHIFGEHIPHSVRAAETSAQGQSIFTYDPKGKVAAAYASLTGEVLNIA